MEQSNVDNCLFTKAGILLVVYVDSAVHISPDQKKISEIKYLQQEYVLTDDRELKDYLRTHFEQKPDGSICFTQPKIIEQAIQAAGLDPDSKIVKLHDTPASEKQILDNDPNGEECLQTWNYQSAIGCLSDIPAMIHPDLTEVVQRCA